MFGSKWHKSKAEKDTSATKGTESSQGRATAHNASTPDTTRDAGGAASGEPNPSGLRRLRLRYTGQVQGVGFRWTSQRVARALGLTGWVKNEWDGSVSMELQGTNEQIAQYFGEFQNQYRDYPIRYTIDEKDDIAPVPDEDHFEVRY